MDRILPYFSFRGRTNRLRYWTTTLALYALLFVASLVGVGVPGIGIMFLFVGLLLASVGGLAVAARRLHDRGKSAWWLLAMYMPMVILSVLGQAASVSDPMAGAGLSALSLPFAIWTFVELGCLRGTVGSNRFGDDPLQPAPVEVFG